MHFLCVSIVWTGIHFFLPVIAGASAAVAATFDLKFCHTFCSSWFSACLCICVCAFHRFRHIFILCCACWFFLYPNWCLIVITVRYGYYVEVWFESKNPHNKSAKTNFIIFHWHSGHFMMIDRASDFIQMVTEIHINLFDTLTIYLPVVSSQKTCAVAFSYSKQLRGECCRHFQGTWYSKLCLRPSFVLTQMIRNQKTLSLWGIIPLGNGWWWRTFYLILSLFQPWASCKHFE